MPQIILCLLIGGFCLLIGAFRGLNALAKGTENSNLYLRNGVRVIMLLTILFSIFYSLHFYKNRDVIFFDKLMKKLLLKIVKDIIDNYPNSKKTSEVRNWIDKQYEHELQCANDSLSLSLFIGKYSNDLL